MKRILFVIGTALLALLFFLAMGQDMNREWNGYQRRFVKSLAPEERRDVKPGIKQLLATDLGRVDRCTTCHMAIDKPKIALGQQPFTAHPGQFLDWHPPEKFGCTTCHGGQGLATETAAAHGEVEHWERPLLRGPLVQASCYKCHGDVETIRQHVPMLSRGMELYKKMGCAGCHAVQGFGQTVSVDLTEVGDKPWQLLDFTFVKGEPTLSQWLDEHFKGPRQITPGYRKDELPPGEEEIYASFMPNFGLSDDDALALTTYMLSLTAEKLPAKFVVPAVLAKAELPPSSPVEAGRLAFVKYGCVGCHGQEGMGGRHNFNAQLGEEIPSLVHAKDYYDRQSLKEFIETGRQPVPRMNASRPRPPVYMPAWKGRIPDAEISAIVEYVLSLNERVPQEPAAAPAPSAPSAPPAAQQGPQASVERSPAT